MRFIFTLHLILLLLMHNFTYLLDIIHSWNLKPQTLHSFFIVSHPASVISPSFLIVSIVCLNFQALLSCGCYDALYLNMKQIRDFSISSEKWAGRNDNMHSIYSHLTFFLWFLWETRIMADLKDIRKCWRFLIFHIQTLQLYSVSYFLKHEKKW